LADLTSATAPVILARGTLTFADKIGRCKLSFTTLHKKFLVKLNWARYHGSLSPDFTPLEFALWGFVKDNLYFPPLPANVDDLRVRIIGAVAEVTPAKLRRTWKEIPYRLSICRATSASEWNCNFDISDKT
jgi:hypothetical protein